MQVRDRIKGLRRVRADQLSPHPDNWRRHPQPQRDAVAGLLSEIGYADALLARELPDGTLQLIDGHLRAETTPNALVPVLVLDVTEQEARKLLVTMDPLAGLAEASHEELDRLLGEVETTCQGVQAMLDDLARTAAVESPAKPEPNVLESYQIVVECADECEQQRLYERFTAEGLTCRVVTL